MKTQIPAQVIDDLMDVYVEWREACVALETAYERWSRVRVAEGKAAFAAYRAALDWEEHASAVYEDRVNRVVRDLPRVRASLATA